MSNPPLIWFSGSGAKIASHLGAACALEELGIKADRYGGISGGAIVATLAALGQAREHKDKVLAITSADLFKPNLFKLNGSLKIGSTLWGLIRSGGKYLSEFSLPEELHTIVDRQRKDLPVFTYVYNPKISRPVYKGYTACWGKVLEEGATIPGLSKVSGNLDAGWEYHYPPSIPPHSILFSVADRPRIDTTLSGVLMQYLERSAWANKQEQNVPGSQYIRLPFCNLSTEYNPALSKKSFEQAYQKVYERFSP